MLVRPFEMPWRRAYEIGAGIAWLATSLYFLAIGVLGAVPIDLALPLHTLCMIMSVAGVNYLGRSTTTILAGGGGRSCR